MVLDTVILPGVDPPDILRKTMNFSVVVCACPLMIFFLSEAMSGQFSGFQIQDLTTIDLAMMVVAAVGFLGFIPMCFWIQIQGVNKINDYLVRNGQILERQLLGALARTYRVSQVNKMILLLIPTVFGLVDATVTRSLLGLVIYLLGQALLIYNLPWPARCNLWMEVKRREILR